MLTGKGSKELIFRCARHRQIHLLGAQLKIKYLNYFMHTAVKYDTATVEVQYYFTGRSSSSASRVRADHGRHASLLGAPRLPVKRGTEPARRRTVLKKHDLCAHVPTRYLCR